MNHDPTPTSPADHDPSPDDHDDNNDNADDVVDERSRRWQRPHRQQQDNSTAAAPPSSPPPSQLSYRAKEGLMKKHSFLLNLLQQLDTLILAELCALYYMEYALLALCPPYRVPATAPVLTLGPSSCSFFRLFIRWLPQWAYLSPKPDNIIFLLPSYHVSAILAPNLACLFLHLVTSLPQTSEASRGYLHGGVLVDFVGQKPPASKLGYFFLDALVLGLQCFMLAVSMERDRVKKIIKPPRATVGRGTVGASAASPIPTNQDLDAEERGVLRDAPIAEDADDIELPPLGRVDCRRAEDEGGDERPGVGHRSAAARRNRVYEDLREVLDSGNAVLANFHVRHALRRAWDDRLNTTENAAALALQGVGYNATLAALAAQRRARLAAGANNTRPRG